MDVDIVKKLKELLNRSNKLLQTISRRKAYCDRYMAHIEPRNYDQLKKDKYVPKYNR